MKRLVFAGAALAIFAAATTSAAGTVSSETHGTRTVRLFVPSKPASPLPMIVMLHGCTQDPAAFADATRMDDVAEENGFVVLYPEQPSSATPTRCWQWWDAAHQARAAGEPKELADLAKEVASARGVDAERIYVAGISAGGAMSVVLGATYPDRFTAIGVVAGLEYQAATSFGGVLGASSKGGPDPTKQGDLVFASMGARARVVPTLVMQGTADGVVAAVNGDQVAAQWRRVAARALGDDAIETTAPTTAEAGYPFTRTLHRNKANGASIVELFSVDGLGHAWPGGKSGGSYADPKGPDASRTLWSFFRGRTLSAPLDVGAPAAATAPPPNASEPAANADSGSGGCSTSRSTPAPFATLAGFLVALFFARRRRRSHHRSP